MFLSDRDLEYAVLRGHLIVDPAPREFGESSIDLHLDRVEEAMVWDANKFNVDHQGTGHRRPALGLGSFDLQALAQRYAHPVPPWADGLRVYRDGDGVVVEPGGFFLWQTAEVVGTREEDARYICFIEGKSTRARAGLIVHLTAPIISAGWWGQVTLEIANLGPFRLRLAPGDSVAQLIVAGVSSPPTRARQVRGIALGQSKVAGTGKARRRKPSS